MWRALVRITSLRISCLALFLLIASALPRLAFCQAARSLALTWQKPLTLRETAWDSCLLCGFFFFSWRNVKVDRTDFWPSEDFIYIRLECQIRCARAPVLLFGALWIGYGMSLRQDQGGNEKEYEFQASMSVLCLFIFRSCHHQAAEEMNKGTDDKNQGKTCPSKNIHMLSEDKYHEMLHVVTKLACVHCLSWQPPSNNKRSTCISF